MERLYNRRFHGPFSGDAFPQPVRALFREETEIGQLAPPLPLADGEAVPERGRQANHRQVKRSQKRRLDGMSIFMDQKSGGNLRKGNGSAFVARRALGDKDKKPQRETGEPGIFRDHSAMVEGVPAPAVPQKDHRPHGGLKSAQVHWINI